jgi:hypothetical protein
MTDETDQAQVAAGNGRGGDLWAAQGFVLGAVFFVPPVFWAYRMALVMPAFKTDACVAAIAAGLGATVCLAGALVFLDRRLSGGAMLAWYSRAALEAERRVIAVLQLGTMGLALAAGAAIAFGLPLTKLGGV